MNGSAYEDCTLQHILDMTRQRRQLLDDGGLPFGVETVTASEGDHQQQ